ncbi:GNAT family N-acetyltransferase [Bacillus sp. REN3]|uniref:GNAT family N-acetyltransferase n=1 Tax=Bacillus sp. REN3 TaxID=2802440 RepID=UPI001AEDD7CD|nr:GNAT family N-acetyltransferase [Bacillus sp. REN3]
MIIRLMEKDEQPPWDLLLLADPSKDMVSGYLSDGITYIAESQDGISGVIVLLPKSPVTSEIINLAVKEDSQGKGIGKLLLQHAIDAAKKAGFKRIEIGTGNSSINQLAMYQKAGFRITGVDKEFFIRNYDKPIFENGIRCRDMIRLSMEI